MRLHFHGADYARKSMHIPSVDQEIRGKYRGVNVSIHQHSVKKHHGQMHNKMTYRGVTYIHE